MNDQAAPDTTYWVFVNWSDGYALVHASDCHVYTDRHELLAGGRPDATQWLGPFTTHTRALAVTKFAGLGGRRRCRTCWPGPGR